MFRSRWGLFWTLAVAVCAGLAGCGASSTDKAGSSRAAAKPTVLTMADPIPGSSDVDAFVSEVNRMSHGTLQIVAKTGWRLGQTNFENGLIRDVQAGKTDLGVAGSRAFDSVGVNSFRALQAPMLINSLALQQRVLTSPVATNMLSGLSPLGLIGLGILPGNLRYPIGVTRPLLKPTDFAGLRIGEQQSKLAAATLKALGATPVPFGVQVPIPGLDGVEQGFGNVGADHFGKHLTLTANVALWPRPLVLFANGGAFAKLTARQRRILRTAAVDAIAPTGEAVRADAALSSRQLCRGGTATFASASPADIAALGRAVQPVYAALDEDPTNRAQIAEIETMRRTLPAAPGFACRQRNPGGTAAASLLDGVYQFNVTTADLAAAHAAPGDMNATGTNTFVFDRGHFAATVESGQSCVWGYGTVTVRGDTVRMLFAEGGGIPANDAPAPGMVFTLRWSLYHDTLTMRRDTAGAAPTPVVATPWMRVTGVPSFGYFSRRCPPPANALLR